MDWNKFFEQALGAVLYSVIGLVFFVVFMLAFIKLTKIPFRKEIEEDQNIALAILLGSGFIAIALIVAAAIHG